MFDPTKPLQTRDGRKVLHIATGFRFLGNETTLAVVRGGDGYHSAYKYYANGCFLSEGTHDFDLVNIPQPRKHADVIKAWADGAEVQIRGGVLGAKWQDCEQPSFCNCMEYRVKP